MPCIIIGHPDHANHLEVLVLDIVVARGTRNQLSIIIYQAEVVERITRSTRGSGRDMYLIIMVVGGAENAIQCVIRPCRVSGSVTSAVGLYRTFHDLLMEISQKQTRSTIKPLPTSGPPLRPALW